MPCSQPSVAFRTPAASRAGVALCPLLLSLQLLQDAAGSTPRWLAPLSTKGVTLRHSPALGLRQMLGLQLFRGLRCPPPPPPPGEQGMSLPEHTLCRLPAPASTAPEKGPLCPDPCFHHSEITKKNPPQTGIHSENSSIFCSFPVQNKQRHKI